MSDMSFEEMLASHTPVRPDMSYLQRFKERRLADEHGDRDVESEPDFGDEPQPGAPRSSGAQHGGDAGPTDPAREPEAVTDSAASHVAPEPEQDVSVISRDSPDRSPVAASLEHTDEQDAVQGLTGGSSSAPATGSDDVGGPVAAVASSETAGARKPRPGFKLRGVDNQPKVANLPPEMVQALRSTLASAAMRELGVSESQAHELADLSKSALVTAFLAAWLDLSLDADEHTSQAVTLFRAHNPLLGSVVRRMEALEHVSSDTHDVTRRLREDLRSMRRQLDVAELSMAWLVAERAGAGVARNAQGVNHIDLQHREALRMLDKARAAAQDQRDIVTRREGRRYA